jgi:FolB domain-containing protein
MRSRIEISPLGIPAHVGCGEAERSAPQTLEVSLSVSSQEGFAACESDALGDTLDASRIQSLVAATIEASRVQTLERLGRLVETALRRELRSSGLDWELHISKPRFGWAYVHAWRT